MTSDRKRAYDALYAAIGGEIRLWADPTGRWQSVHTLKLTPQAETLLKALVEELSKAPHA